MEFHGWHAPCGKLDHKRSRPVPGLNRPKRVRRTDNGIDEPPCLCGYRVWVERGKRRRRPDSGAAYLASVGPVTVLYYPSLCRSSSPRQTYGAAVGCSKLLTFQTSSETFPEMTRPDSQMLMTEPNVSLQFPYRGRESYFISDVLNPGGRRSVDRRPFPLTLAAICTRRRSALWPRAAISEGQLHRRRRCRALESQ